MKTFNLPDLGEGLPEAEIVTWHVSEGDVVRTDDALVSVETAKAVVEVPAPYSGRIEKLYAAEGDIVETGKPLVDFGDENDAGDRARGDGGNGSGARRAEEPPQEPVAEAAGEASARDEGNREGEDSGTVVGDMPRGDQLVAETAVAGGRRRRGSTRVKAAPSVRAEAKRRGIDLAEVTPSGRSGQVTLEDLERYEPPPEARPKRARATRPPSGEAEALRGPRRAMAMSMSATRDQVATCTIFDDADIDAWIDKRDFTARMLRAIAAGCRVEPALNGFFDGEALTRRLESRVDVAMAVDTEDGLIVPVIRSVERKRLAELREDVQTLKEATRKRAIAPEDMTNYTIMLSNYGMLVGRYATPLLVPPVMAILGSGKLQHDVVAVMGGIEVHRRIPLSLSFDHRAVTGGEACRFLSAVIEDLSEPQ